MTTRPRESRWDAADRWLDDPTNALKAVVYTAWAAAGLVLGAGTVAFLRWRRSE